MLMANSVLHCMTLTRNTPEDRGAVLAFQCSCLLLNNNSLFEKLYNCMVWGQLWDFTVLDVTTRAVGIPV